MTICPHCGLEKGEGPKYYGHLSYCKQHPETRKKDPKLEGSGKSASTTRAESTSNTTIPPASTAVLQPVTFSFSEGERLPAQQEIPEFKSPEEEKKEAREGKPETVKATLAEERRAGVSAIAALILPLFEMWNRSVAGEAALPGSPEQMKLTKDDAEMLAQAVILVDQKHGGPLSKTLGSEEYGAEIFLAGVSLGIGIKMAMALRLRQSRKPVRQSAAPSTEELQREKSPLEKMGESLKNLVTPKEKPKTEEEKKPEGTLSQDDFMKAAEEYQKRAISP